MAPADGLTNVAVNASHEPQCSERHLDQVRDDPIEHGDGQSDVVVLLVEVGARAECSEPATHDVRKHQRVLTSMPNRHWTLDGSEIAWTRCLSPSELGFALAPCERCLRRPARGG